MTTTRRLTEFFGLVGVVAVAFFAVQAMAGEGEPEGDGAVAADEERADAVERGRDAAEGLQDRVVDAVGEPEEAFTAEELEAGRKAFADVAEVLQSPRCMNCHPAGNRPLQTDDSTPHSFAVSRTSTESGLECATCHREQNSEAWGVAGGPPGSPHWGLPPRQMPMVFEGRTLRELCEQLKDPERSGHANLDEFIEHLIHDPLVHWGWEPGGDRSTPPLSYEDFLDRARDWVEVGGPCPE